jgi:hypothetical protein
MHQRLFNLALTTRNRDESSVALCGYHRDWMYSMASRVLYALVELPIRTKNSASSLTWHVPL